MHPALLRTRQRISGWLVLLLAMSLTGCVLPDPQPPGFSSTWHRMQLERASAQVSQAVVTR